MVDILLLAGTWEAFIRVRTVRLKSSLRLVPPCTGHDPDSIILDPLFYLHHAGIDRVWWKWQQDEPSKRLLEIGGRSSPNPPYGTANLDLLLEFGDLAPPVPLREVMDVAYEPYCYAYP